MRLALAGADQILDGVDQAIRDCAGIYLETPFADGLLDFIHLGGIDRRRAGNLFSSERNCDVVAPRSTRVP